MAKTMTYRDGTVILFRNTVVAPETGVSSLHLLYIRSFPAWGTVGTHAAGKVLSTLNTLNSLIYRSGRS